MSDRQQKKKQARRARPAPPKTVAASEPPLPLEPETKGPSWLDALAEYLKGPTDPRTQIWHYAVIALLPAVLTVLNRNWLFQNGPHMDPWFYFGHILHFPRMHNLLPDYTGERMGWIAPGYILTHIFGAVPGLIALHISVYLASLYLLYFILARLVDGSTALCSSVLLGCNSFFIGPNGWDYPEGLAMVFLLLSLALAIPASTRRPFLYRNPRIERNPQRF